MKRASPPRHRHDGTSPLPLGMDWSPPPKKWEGRNTVWPHDPHTGWSYCVMIPSWVSQTDPGASNDSLLNPIVFFRIQVGIQSPDGLSSIHGILHRFSDFQKLYSALKRAFPKKDIPPAPPKHTLLRVNLSRQLLEQRRRALEEWMGRLLSDLDLSRSAPVASFLELEVAARSAFQVKGQLSLETSHDDEASAISSSQPERSHSGVSLAGSSAALASNSVTSDSDNVYETLDTTTSSQVMAHGSETGRETVASTHDLSASMGEISNGILAGGSAFDRQEVSSRVNSQLGKESFSPVKDTFGGNSSGEIPLLKERIEILPEQDHDKLSGHSRKVSADSIGSDVSSLRGSELSMPGVSNSMWNGAFDFNSIESRSATDAQIVLPFDQRHKLNRLLVTMQQRLVTARTDMEDLIARLNQEMAVKEYLTTKVKDLEGELEVTKQKSKEHLQQAVLIERERVTRMQWDMEELRREYAVMESKLKIEQSEKTRAETEKSSASSEKNALLQDLDSKQEQIGKLQRHLEEVEIKSKSDIKVLVKEVKSLRSSKTELKELLNQSMKEKSELERVLQREMQSRARSKSARKKLLHDCEVLRHRLQECSVNFLTEGEDKFTVSPSSFSDALDLLATSDNRIGLLLAEAQLLAQDDDRALVDSEKSMNTGSSESLMTPNGDDLLKAEDEIRKMLADILVDNARLRKQVNAVIRCAFKNVLQPEKDDGEVPSRKTVLGRFLDR